METGAGSRAVEDGWLEVVENQLPRTASEESQRVDQTAVELGLALRQRELDELQAAVAEHGHKHRDFARRRAHLDAVAFAPIDPHGPAGLINHPPHAATTCGPDPTQAPTRPAATALVVPRITCVLLPD